MQDNNLEKLINSFTLLPGVGRKTAERYAYSILNMPAEDVTFFATSMKDARKTVKFCSICGNFTENDVCDICRNRKSDLICVVKEPRDVVAIEKSKAYNGLYHVLHGTISPIEGKGPNEIRIKELLMRLNKSDIKEVIMATNPDVEGEATATYIARLLKPMGIKVTRLAQGIQMGSDLQYADEVSLSRAISDRREL